MENKIKLTIQEIVKDFERMVRYDEKLDVMFTFQKCSDEEITEFLNFMTDLMVKYLPNYREHISDDFDDKSDYDKALELYKDLYQNFREIFYKLV